jgi:hypothetical protein
MIEFRCRLIEYSEATLPEDAFPGRSHEGCVEDPRPLLLWILERDHLVEILMTSGKASNRNALGRASDCLVRGRWCLGTRRA